MAIPASIQPYIVAAVGVLIALRIYVRLRRAVGRQRYSTTRNWIQVVLYPLVAALLLVAAFVHPLNAMSEVAGLAIGAALGLYSLRRTRFESANGVDFYTPNAHIGIALSSLLIVRIPYRLVAGYVPGAGLSQPPADFVRSPLTLLIVGTLAGYYFTYAVGLL